MSPTQQIPFVGLDRQHAEIGEDLRSAFERVLAVNGFILGAEVDAFEHEFADYCGTAHCVGVASGTSALALTLIAAGVGHGDEVVLPAHTFIASALAILHAGATPVLCDVDDGSGLIDPDAAAAAVTPRTAAILAVHLYGQVCDMDRLEALAQNKGLALFEDAAQAHGATFQGRRAGGFGRAAGFSFYPSKNLGALGDGGAICTNDPSLAEQARQLRNLGQRNKGEHLVVGFNERLDGLQAALLRAKLPHLDRWNEARRRHAAAYRAALEGVRLLEERPDRDCIYHLFPVRTDDRDSLVAALEAGRVQTGVHYSPPIHQQPATADHVGGDGDYPVASAWADQELSLPMFEGLRDDEVSRVAELVRASVPVR